MKESKRKIFCERTTMELEKELNYFEANNIIIDVCIKTLLFTIVIILLQEYSLLQMLFI